MPSSIISGIGSALVGKAMGSLLGGSSKGTNPSQTQISEFLIPDELKPDYDALISASRGLFAKPFTEYTDPRFAQFNPDQLNAFQGIRDLQGKYSGLFDQSADLASQSASMYAAGITPEEIQKFMNPYQQGVIDISKRETLRDFDKQLMGLKGQQAAQGAFGGSRGALMESELYRNTGQQLDDMQYRGLSDSYSQALQAAFKNREGMAASSMNLANIAGAGQAYGLKDLTALGAAGEAQQGLAQKKLDFNFDEFNRELAYEPSRINQFNSFLQGWMPRSGQMTTNPGSPSPLAQALGYGSALNGMIGGGGLSGIFSNMFGSMSNGYSNGFASNLFGATGGPSANTGIDFGNILFKDGGMVGGKNCYADGGAVGDSPRPKMFPEMGEAEWALQQAIKDLKIAEQMGFPDYVIEQKRTTVNELANRVNSTNPTGLYGGTEGYADGGKVKSFAEAMKEVDYSDHLWDKPLTNGINFDWNNPDTPFERDFGAGISAIKNMFKNGKDKFVENSEQGATGLYSLFEDAVTPFTRYFNGDTQATASELASGEGDNYKLGDKYNSKDTLGMRSDNPTTSEGWDEADHPTNAEDFSMMDKGQTPMQVMAKSTPDYDKSRALMGLGIGLLSTPGNFNFGLAEGMKRYMAELDNQDDKTLKREAVAETKRQNDMVNSLSLGRLEQDQLELGALVDNRKLQGALDLMKVRQTGTTERAKERTNLQKAIMKAKTDEVAPTDSTFRAMIGRERELRVADLTDKLKKGQLSKAQFQQELMQIKREKDAQDLEYQRYVDSLDEEEDD